MISKEVATKEVTTKPDSEKQIFLQKLKDAREEKKWLHVPLDIREICIKSLSTGISKKEIADALGLCSSTIHYWLKVQKKSKNNPERRIPSKISLLDSKVQIIPIKSDIEKIANKKEEDIKLAINISGWSVILERQAK